MVYRHLLTTPKQSKDTLRKETGEQGKAEEDRKEQEERGEDMAGQGNAGGKRSGAWRRKQKGKGPTGGNRNEEDRGG